MTLAEMIEEVNALRTLDMTMAIIADFLIQRRCGVLTFDEGAADLGSDLLGLLGVAS